MKRQKENPIKLIVMGAALLVLLVVLFLLIRFALTGSENNSGKGQAVRQGVARAA